VGQVDAWQDKLESVQGSKPGAVRLWQASNSYLNMLDAVRCALTDNPDHLAPCLKRLSPQQKHSHAADRASAAGRAERLEIGRTGRLLAAHWASADYA
jgi:hypothetical protein